MAWKRNRAGGLEWAPDPVTPVSTGTQPPNPYALPPLPSTGMSGLVPRPTPPTPPLQRYPLGTVPQTAPADGGKPVPYPAPPPQPGVPNYGSPGALRLSALDAGVNKLTNEFWAAHPDAPGNPKNQPASAPQSSPRDFSKTGFTVPLNQTNIHSPEERDAMQARINANPIQSPAQRQPAGVPTEQIPVGKSMLGQYVNDSPLAGVAMVNARYQLGAQASELEVKTLAKQTFGQLGQLIAAYDHPQAKDGADAALDLIARQAWYRQTGGQSGDPEAAPREYLESWKGAWRTGQEVPLGKELNAQLKSQGVEPQFARANVNAKMNQWGTLEQERQQQEATGTGIYAPPPPPPPSAGAPAGYPRPTSRPATEADYGPGIRNAPIPGGRVDETTGRPGIVQGGEVDEVTQAATAAGIDPILYHRLVGQESGGNQGAVSPVGAAGAAQLMPDTARYLSSKYGLNTNTRLGNLTAGAYYFKEQLDKYGSVPLALAAYNAGPGAVDQYGGVPPYHETQDYVQRIGSGYTGTGRTAPAPMPTVGAPYNPYNQGR